MSLASTIEGLNTTVEYLGGPLVIALFYWFRFHTLKGTRSYTTRALYYFGIVTFEVPIIFIYFLLVVEGFSPLTAIWILILLWLTPSLPKLWRSVCHRIALIPICAHALRDELESAPFELPPEDMSVIRRKLGRFGYQIDDFRAAQSTAIQSRFLKIAAIMHNLEQWHLRGEAFVERNSELYSDLLHVFDLLSFKTIRALNNTAAIYSAIIEESKVQPDDWHALDSLSKQDLSTNKLQSAAQTAAGCMLEDLRKDMDFLLDKLLLFIARASLASEWNFKGRKRRLEAIGFTIVSPAASIMPTLFASAATTVVFSLIWFGVMGDRMPGLETRGIEMTRSIVLPSLNIICNLLLVFHFKRNYSFATDTTVYGYPVAFILSVGIITAFVMFPFRSSLDYAQFVGRDFGHVLVYNLPLSLYPWVTGAVIALLAQDSMWCGFKHERTRQIMDGAAFGAALLFVMVLLWAINRVVSIPALHALNQTSVLSMIVGFFGSSFVFGFVIGYLFIGRVRDGSSLSILYRKTMWRGSLMRV